MRLRRLLAPLLLVVLGAFALALSACGGSDKDAKGLLRTAFKQPIQSADVSMDLQIKIEGVEQLKNPITVRLTGPYRTNGSKKLPSADFDLSFAGGGQTFNAGLTSTGDNAFVSFQGTDYEVGEDTVAQVNRQIAQSANQRSKRSLSEFGVDPLNWIRDASEKGEEDVAGVKTKHVSGGLDLGRLLDDLNNVVDRAGKLGGAAGQTPPKLTDQQKKQIEDVLKDPEFDVYVGKDDNKVRRLSADLKLDVPESARGRLGGAEGGSISFSIEFANVGEAQQVKAPTSAKPIKELLDKLGGLGGLGSLGGGGTGTTPGGTSTTPGSVPGGTTTGKTPDVKQFEKYSDCLKKANPNDVGALSKCAELLR
jgi:hypothetical protein